nr:hypothetical protein CFP56_12784 [Quercus suber]
MDTSENIVLGLERSGVIQSSEAVEEQGIVEEVGIKGPFVGMNSSGQENFEDKLREIDSDLAVFDDENLANPRSIEVVSVDVHSSENIMGMGLGTEGIGARVQEDFRVSTGLENCNFSGGSLRGWKRLARDREVVVQPGSLSGGKRSMDVCLEGEANLVPTKRRCASVKSNETMEADDQPRQAQ